jgi:hypothetical protein
VESEVKAILEKEKLDPPKPKDESSVTSYPSGRITIDPAWEGGTSDVTVSSGWTTTTSSSVTFEDPMTKTIEDIVRRILEEEGVLVSISGKAKTYSRETIAISKSDPSPESIKITEKSDESLDFIEELRKL